ncbi:MAG TPA: hypothetical protein PKE26_14710 [Kiritimatiellia bacterium]|nr:hypothetical protein [Kiritimatiellia bacterium]HMP00352.1 hypothetical protein [Kiritimatiellia bacterium]HMP96035.1 hypothetical protein [Kiritimatiellia bacterium]
MNNGITNETMNHRGRTCRHWSGPVAALLAVLLLGACNSDSKSEASSTIRGTTNSVTTVQSSGYPKIAGKWSGNFYRTDTQNRRPLEATITQNKEAVTITTTRTGGIGVNFAGTITPEGRMTLTDAYDGETWTTYFGPATTNRIAIADFVNTPVPGETNRVLYVISLSR